MCFYHHKQQFEGQSPRTTHVVSQTPKFDMKHFLLNTKGMWRPTSATWRIQQFVCLHEKLNFKWANVNNLMDERDESWRELSAGLHFSLVALSSMRFTFSDGENVCALDRWHAPFLRHISRGCVRYEGRRLWEIHGNGLHGRLSFMRVIKP
jgi:hypothetical protein